MFTMENTEGYTQEEISIMNGALVKLMDGVTGENRKSTADHRSADVERLLEIAKDYISDYDNLEDQAELFRKNNPSDCFTDTLATVRDEFKNIPDEYTQELNTELQHMIINLTMLYTQ